MKLSTARSSIPACVNRVPPRPIVKLKDVLRERFASCDPGRHAPLCLNMGREECAIFLPGRPLRFE